MDGCEWRGWRHAPGHADASPDQNAGPAAGNYAAGDPAGDSQPVADWCAHTFPFAGSDWLIFCNTTSLYVVCASAKGVTDGESLARRAGGMIPLVLHKNGFKAQADKFSAELTDFQWAPIPGRSVLGSINDLIYQAMWLLEDGDLLPEELSVKLGTTPMSALGMNNPAKVLVTLSS